MRVVLVILGTLSLTIVVNTPALAETKRAKAAADPPATAQPVTEDAGPTPREVVLDTNKDGKPDRWERYEESALARIEADTNFDGKADEWATFVNGKVTKIEKDTDYDGKSDRWVNY